MANKKQSKKKKPYEKASEQLKLATAVINLIAATIWLIKKILE